MEFLKGNLLDADTQALVNTVNTVGVMGKGIALQFKEKFPHNFKVYAAACKKKELHTGKLLVVLEHTLEGEKIIINFPTKTEWYMKSRYEYIEDGLKELTKVIDEYKIQSIAIPPLGCGNGGLKWDRVKSMMQKFLSPLSNVKIEIFEPNDAVKQILKQQESNKEIKLTPARAMVLYAMFYYESLGEESSLFVANKLAYFLRRLGEKSLNTLTFDAGRYGPYSVQVQHLLRNLNGKYLKGLEQMEAKPFEALELQYDRMQEISDYVKKELKPEQKKRLSELVKLIDGFQTALSLEVLASVDFVTKDNPGMDQQTVVETIHNWTDRKHKLFPEKYIQIALNHLNEYSKALSFS